MVFSKSAVACPSTIIPFARWPVQGCEAAWLADLDLPHLRQWLTQAKRVDWPAWSRSPNAHAALTLPHEQAVARLSGWSVADGQVPWAAQAAIQAGLTTPTHAQGWGFVSLCHWQVSNGQVTLADPAQLNVSVDEDQALLAAMQSFFAEDGLTLYPYQPGCWLVQSNLLVDLATASLDRVVGQDVNAWLVGCESTQLSASVTTLCRLQNEMQMLLYTHAVNTQRAQGINSFWLHGTGSWRGDLVQPAHVHMVCALRDSALQQNGQAWLDRWRELDAQLLPELLQQADQGQPQRLVLCGPNSIQVYETQVQHWWQRWRTRFQTVSMADTLTETLEND